MNTSLGRNNPPNVDEYGKPVFRSNSTYEPLFKLPSKNESTLVPLLLLWYSQNLLTKFQT